MSMDYPTSPLPGTPGGPGNNRGRKWQRLLIVLSVGLVMLLFIGGLTYRLGLIPGFSSKPVASSQTAGQANGTAVNPLPQQSTSSPQRVCTVVKPKIGIDDGHSGGTQARITAATAEVDSRKGVTVKGVHYRPVYITGSGIVTVDNGGATGELHNMWLAGKRIAKILRAHGYEPVFTKKHEADQVGLLTRVKELIDAHVVFAVSLHYTGPEPGFKALFGHSYPGVEGVTPQALREFRQNQVGGQRITFRNTKVARQSRRDAKIIQQARAAAGDAVADTPLSGSFPKGRLPAWGNISIVQVADQVFPWVYNEDGSVHFNLKAYSTGIANGIMQAVPIPKPVCTAGKASGPSPTPTASSGPSRSVLVEPPDSQLPAKNPAAFVARIAPYAVAAQHKYKVPAAVTIAQAMVESRFGTSKLATVAQDYFGMKCRSSSESCVWYKPFGGSTMHFRSFTSVKASVTGYAQHLVDTGAYAAAMKVASDPTKFIQVAGPIYSGDKTGGYVKDVLRDIKLYNLTKYDRS